jgi:type I restriction enzyme M protein
MEDRDTKETSMNTYSLKLPQQELVRTPRHIIRMMVDMVQPTKEDTICDPQQGRIPSFSR